MSRASSRRPSGAVALEKRLGELGQGPVPALVGWLLALAGVVSLVCAMIPVGPDLLRLFGSVAIVTTFTWALAVRTGGRPLIFAPLALVGSLVAIVSDQDVLLASAAVGTATLAALLGVMATVPAAGFWTAARECVLGVSIAGIGAMAAIGFEPAVDEETFEFVGLGLSFVIALILVFRLGGMHGLGRRGIIVVVVGAILLAASVTYAEVLREQGSEGLVEELRSWVGWSRDTFGAFPRPIAAALGVPALAYGCHMRARRRQGWWVCVFGVAATSPAATSLANPAVSVSEALLSVLYGLLIGLVVGWLLIRLDLALTGNRGRRSRVAEREAAVRPEPGRFAPLL